MHLTSKQNMALAASVAALMIAAPLRSTSCADSISIRLSRRSRRRSPRTAAALSRRLRRGRRVPSRNTLRRPRPHPRSRQQHNRATASRGRTRAEARLRDDARRGRRRPTSPLPPNREEKAKPSSVQCLGRPGGDEPARGLPRHRPLQCQRHPRLRNPVKPVLLASEPTALAKERTTTVIALPSSGARLDGRTAQTDHYAMRKQDAQAWMGGEADADLKIAPQMQEENRDKFDAKAINPVKQVATEPVSTFSIDVDTASYASCAARSTPASCRRRMPCASRR